MSPLAYGRDLAGCSKWECLCCPGVSSVLVFGFCFGLVWFGFKVDKVTFEGKKIEVVWSDKGRQYSWVVLPPPKTPELYIPNSWKNRKYYSTYLLCFQWITFNCCLLFLSESFTPWEWATPLLRRRHDHMKIGCYVYRGMRTTKTNSIKLSSKSLTMSGPWNCNYCNITFVSG